MGDEKKIALYESFKTINSIDVDTTLSAVCARLMARVS